jgi:hypothetical protein
MDLKFVSPNILLFIYGLLGALFYSCICTFSTYFKCDDSKEINIYDYICKYKENGNKTEKYFENFNFYFNTSNNKIDIIIEIITVILGSIGYYFYKFYMLLTLKYLTPVHIMFILPIFYFFHKTFGLIFNCIVYIFKKGPFIKNNVLSSFISKFILDICGDIFSIIGFLIYLEILKLSFCNLDYNLRVNIIERSKRDSLLIIDNNDEESVDDEEDAQENDHNISQKASLNSID